MPNFQINTIAPPVTMPAKAPGKFVRFQNRANRITGPNAAPKPAQANETMSNTEESGFSASSAPITATTITVPRATHITSFSLAFLWMIPLKKFCATLEEAARSWESAVDMVAARIPASTTPANSARITP